MKPRKKSSAAAKKEISMKKIYAIGSVPRLLFASGSGAGLTLRALCVVTMLGSAPAFAQTPFTTGIRLADHTPPQVLNGTATFVGHYDPTRKLRLSFAIVPPHLQEEEQFLTELQTKGSPNFHHFLTPEDGGDVVETLRGVVGRQQVRAVDIDQKQIMECPPRRLD
jgi:Pro-kumamolisin, activation domain